MNPSLPTADDDEAPRAPTDTPASVTLHVGPAAVARIAAYYTRQDPGVLALHPDLPQYLTGIADQVLGRRPPADPDLATGGVSVTIDTANGRAHVSITIITRIGINCRTIADTIQHDVAEQIFAHTKLIAHIAITIADIALDV